MLLVMDIGNTNIKTGLFENGVLQHSWRLTTDTKRTADEYGVHLEAFFRHLRIPTASVDGIIVSSVIPSINYTTEHMCALYFHGLKPLLVSPRLKLGLTLQYDQPDKLGADRICNAVAAYRMYGGPLIVVDFGTATSFSVVSADGKFLGGVICPGIMVSSDALVEKAAMLNKVELGKPDKIIGTNTEDNIRSGVIRGYVGQVDYIIRQIEGELGCRLKTVATGGMSGMIASDTDRIDCVNPTLTLQGLAYIYEMNH
ncbi:MAG: type III pantothenate kinase [Christensenellaceae bacterium]|jgi:type III pantothenate kinase|nr:type III pantothenate kinase [Christensenellaceae bacterium]